MKPITGQKKKHDLTVWWAYFISLFLLVIIAILTYAKNSDSKVFVILLGYILLVWIPIGIKNIVEIEKVKDYLIKYHPDKWVNKFGSQKTNLPLIKFFLLKEDFGDQGLANVKRAYQKILILSLCIALSFPFLAVIMLILTLLRK